MVSYMTSVQSSNVITRNKVSMATLMSPREEQDREDGKATLDDLRDEIQQLKALVAASMPPQTTKQQDAP